MSELPREVAREGRGLGASEGSQIRYVVVYVVVSGLPRIYDSSSWLPSSPPASQ